MEEQRCRNCEYFQPTYQARLWSDYGWRGECNYPIDVVLPEGMRITGYGRNEYDGQNCKYFKEKETA